MISYQSPGVYIEEISSGPQPITAAPTSVVAIVGATERGPFQQPTRITGWAEFQTVFGRPVSGYYTAQAMYGFFENGGPAAYVVRCDESVTATWKVQAPDHTTRLFGIEAASPGGWAGRLGLSVVPDLTNGGGRLYASSVDLTAEVTLAAKASQQVFVVTSVQGVTVGDTVRVFTPAGERRATVESVDTVKSTLTLNVLAGPELVLPPKATWLAAQVPTGADTLRLLSGGGFHRGEALAVVTPWKKRQSVVVGAVTATVTGPLLALAEPLTQEIPAAEFAVRTVRLSARLNGTAAQGTRFLALTDLTWEDEPVPQADDLMEGHRAVAEGGLTGEWKAATTQLEFPQRVPVGPVEVDVQVAARPFEEKRQLEHPTLEELRNRFSFVPDGMTVKLLRKGGTPLSLVRDSNTDSGWEEPPPDPSTEVWDHVQIQSDDATNGIVVRCVRPPEPGTDFIQLGGDAKHAIKSVERHDNAYLVIVEGTSAVEVGGGDRYPLHRFERTSLTAQRFTLKVSEDGTEAETYGQLALHRDHPRFYFKDGIINGVSARITVNPPATAAETNPAAEPLFVDLDQQGGDRPVTGAGLKQGFTALERVTEPAMVICPDLLSLTDGQLQIDVVGAMTRHCEEFRRFAIVDAPQYQGQDQKLADWRREVVNSIQAGTYAPHLRMVNLVPEAAERIVSVPPSGFVAGVFARTDRERGVHKAPANERVSGIVGLEEEYTQRRQDLLNPAGVNLIRSFPGRGTRVWGARTSTDDALWRYVNVRRLFNMVEISIEQATNWVVFEPNNQDTWLRIRVSVENFLDQLFRAGALAGTSPEQAYRVRVGLGETMTETDVDQGLVITEVGIAPVKPAEFVVFRFSHKRLTE